ncbi:MAG: DUF5131 family protein, partial [Thermoguttaceae bacterium]
KNCYAEADFDIRRKRAKWGPNGTRVITSDAYWRQPLKWDAAAAQSGTRHRVFCASLADVFEDWQGPILSSDGTIMGKEYRASGGNRLTMGDVRQRLFELIDSTPNLDWLLLTKRPENIRRMWCDRSFCNDKSIEEVRMPVSGFPGYEVSNLGIVYTLRGAERCCMCGADVVGNKQKRYCSHQCRQKSHYRRTVKNEMDPHGPTAKPLDGDIGDDGHIRVTLYRNGESERILVHRMVLATFDRPAGELEQARHLDGNPANNRIDNLCWGSQSMNWDDSKDHRTHRRYYKLSSDQVDDIRDRRRCGETLKAIADYYGVSSTQVGNIVSGRQWKNYLPRRENCWLGTSVENQEWADRRIPQLMACRGLSPVLFLSCEPLLGEVDLTSVAVNAPYEGIDCINGQLFDYVAQETRAYAKIDWVIAGGESGVDARPMHPDWVRLLRDQCQTSGVPFLFKQFGEWGPESAATPTQVNNATFHIYPGGERVFRVGKKNAGRLLDGRTHDGFPELNFDSRA